MVYKTAAKYGHKLAKMLAPEKVKRTTKAGLKMLPKGMQKGFVDLQKSEHVLARGAHKAINGTTQKGYQLYGWTYGKTLSTPTQRKVTSGVVTTAGILKLMDD